MNNIFTLGASAKPKTIVFLPDNVCYPTNYQWLSARIINPSGLSPDDFAFYPVEVPTKGKLKKAQAVKIAEEALEYAELYNITNFIVGIADLYKIFTNDSKFVLNIGRAISGVKLKKDKTEIDLTKIKIIPLLNPVLLNKYPQKITDVQRGLNTAKAVIEGTYVDPIKNLTLEKNEIITDPEKAIETLKYLFKFDKLFVDIETTGLRWYADELLTIAFAPNDKEAYCIAVHKQYHSEKTQEKMIKILKQFFIQFSKKQKKLIGHNWIGFDHAFIVHHIMRDKNFSIPHEPLIEQFQLEDTILMAYLLYNSTERPSIGLKELAFKYLGDWDSDIDQKNLRNAPLKKVGTYNNYDVIATAKIYSELHSDIQKSGFEKTYETFRQIGKQILKMQMHGLRVNLEKAKQFSIEMEEYIKAERNKMLNSKYVKEAEQIIAAIALEKYNSTHKTKKYSIESFLEPFNPDSPKQKRILFFDVMNLPVIKKSKKTKEPAVDAETLNAWLDDPSISDDKKETIKDIIEYTLAQKIQNTYLKSVLNEYVEVAKGDYRIFANFNQTATISGRLSSSGTINMQTIPSNSKYAKPVKELFIAPEGFVLGASDYSALEDRLIANESKDKNKIRIFKENIDAHSLNAYTYFREEFKERGIEIDLNDVNSINSIKQLAPDLRQKGKAYTFGFSYGASPQKYGEKLYNAYWSIYKGVKEYNDKIIEQARKNGYLISKFSGLRLWLPAINSYDEFAREKEERVAINFSIQSGNFLMLLAIDKFQRWIEKNNLIDSVKIVNTVHDAVYLYIKKDPKIIQLVNENLIKFMTEPYEPDLPVQLEANLDIGKNLASLVELDNNASIETIEEILQSL